MSHIVIAHHLDSQQGVYRVVCGIPVVTATAQFDEDGVLVVDDDDQPVTTEEIVDYADVRDVVFDAGDDRWFDENGGRRPVEDIAAEQRAEVAAAIGALQVPEPEVMPEQVNDFEAMPGVGEAL